RRTLRRAAPSCPTLSRTPPMALSLPRPPKSAAYRTKPTPVVARCLYTDPFSKIEGKAVLGPDAVIARIAERQHSVFSVAQAGRCGLDTSAVQRRVNSGRFERVHASVLRICGVALTIEGRAMAAVLAAGRGAVGSFVTAGRR